MHSKETVCVFHGSGLVCIIKKASSGGFPRWSIDIFWRRDASCCGGMLNSSLLYRFHRKVLHLRHSHSRCPDGFNDKGRLFSQTVRGSFYELFILAAVQFLFPAVTFSPHSQSISWIISWVYFSTVAGLFSESLRNPVNSVIVSPVIILSINNSSFTL